MKATLVLDLGNSQTRIYTGVKPVGGKFANTEIAQFKLASNEFYELQPGYSIPDQYKPTDSTIIRVKGDYDGYYANGKIVEREFEKMALKPTANRKKWSFNSLLSFAYAVVMCGRLISKKYGISPDEITYDVTVLVPAFDFSQKGKEEMEAEFAKLKMVEDVFTGNSPVEYPVTIDNFDIFPEEFSAFIGCVFNPDLTCREGYEKYLSTTVLVLGIGAGTSDIMLISDSEVIDNSKDTFNQGGNNVKSLLKRKLKMRFGTSNIPERILEYSVETGCYNNGNTVEDVTEEVNEAKREVAKALVAEIQTYMNDMPVPLQNVTAIAIFGGGVLASELPEVMGNTAEEPQPMSRYIQEYLKEFAPNIENIEIPDIETVLEGKEFSPEALIIYDENNKLVSVNTRLMNIVGARILAENK